MSREELEALKAALEIQRLSLIEYMQSNPVVDNFFLTDVAHPELESNKIRLFHAANSGAQKKMFAEIRRLNAEIEDCNLKIIMMADKEADKFTEFRRNLQEASPENIVLFFNGINE